jgi:hypothetical protein
VLQLQRMNQLGVRQAQMTTICVAEDRESCEPVLRLLLASIDKSNPRLEVHVFHPESMKKFSSWAGKYPQVKLHPDCFDRGHGWNVKPRALLYLMDRGFEDITWIDSDIIVARSLANLYRGLSSDTIMIAEEALWATRDDSDALRARLWGFRVGRVLPFALNSGVLRVTKAHYDLLKRWNELLGSETYRRAQAAHWSERPAHLLGDQDVLTALLASDEYANIPLRLLRRGDIIQYFSLGGYTVHERLRNFVGLGPSFVHSQGVKPWTLKSGRLGSTGAPKLRTHLEEVYLDLSPYTRAARKFKAELDGNTDWMRTHFVLSGLLAAIGLWYPPLVGLPIAAAVDLMRLKNRVLYSEDHPGSAQHA